MPRSTTQAGRTVTEKEPGKRKSATKTVTTAARKGDSNTVTITAPDGTSVTATTEEMIRAGAALELDQQTGNVGGIAGRRLLAIIERVERLEEEKKALADDIKDVFGEAKATGFDVKTIRKIIRLRKMDADKRREDDELLSSLDDHQWPPARKAA